MWNKTESLHVGSNRTRGCWPHLRVKWGLVNLFTCLFENITNKYMPQDMDGWFSEITFNKSSFLKKGLGSRAVTLALVVFVFLYLLLVLFVSRVTKMHGVGFELGFSGLRRLGWWATDPGLSLPLEVGRT